MTALFHTHPFAIAAFALDHAPAALVFVTAVAGGSVRAPGLRMAVAADGAMAGFVSNGCVDGDIAAHCRDAIATGQVQSLRYGHGTDRIDIVLPCGGRVDLLVVPVLPRHRAVLAGMIGVGRTSGWLSLTAQGAMDWQAGEPAPVTRGWVFQVHPRIRLLVVGTGTEALMLARLAQISDMEVVLLTPDQATLRSARALDLPGGELKGLSTPPELAADPLTAIALMFHDHEWEREILRSALAGPAFYIGALGSRRAHDARTAMLAQAGLTPEAIARIRAPIGLVHRLREPNLLAAAVIAEIAAAFQQAYGAF